jgi:uncharacterized membrane protein
MKSFTLLIFMTHGIFNNAFSFLPTHRRYPHKLMNKVTMHLGSEKPFSHNLIAGNDNGKIMERKALNPKSAFESIIWDSLKSSTTRQLAIISMFVMSLIIPMQSQAAISGGRIGGSSPARTRVAPSRSSNMNSRRQYNGGYSRGLGPSINNGFTSGYAAGYLTAPRFGFSPFMTPSYFNPYNYRGAGVISYNPGPSIGQVILFGGLVYAISSVLRRDNMDFLESTDEDTYFGVLGSGTSYIKISVALDVPNRDDAMSILSVLNRLGQSSNSESQTSIQRITSQGKNFQLIYEYDTI